MTEAATEERETPRGHASIGPRRLVVRLLACLISLAVIDAVAVRAAGPEPHVDPDWRAPAELPSAALPAAMRSLDRAGALDTPVVAFTGASPTWGDGLAYGSQALPAVWARLAREQAASRDREAPRVVNLAFNGQLMADTGTIARAAARRADVVFVQVTYRTFSPKAREGATRRFPELPRLLAEPVGPAEAVATRTRRTPSPDVTGAVDRALRRVWRLYDLRDILASRLLGAAPDERLLRAWEDATLPPVDDEERFPVGTFDDLPPDEQTLLAEEWAADADFELAPGNTELAALDALADDLAAADATTVVYLAPVNTAALESFGYLDRAGYDHNVATIRRAVERHGLRFIDLNHAHAWRSADFIDISHTTAIATATAARLLWNETSSTVNGAP